MGIESLLQQNNPNTDSTGIGDTGRFDFMNKGMYPMSQLNRSQYATPTQMPLGAQAAIADYDPATNPLTGEMVSRFAEGGIASFKTGGSPFADDPNNFAEDLTRAYQTTLGRDPSTEELRANVDALNRDPDAYAFIVDQLAEDPSAAKFYAENAKPQVDEEGNVIDAPAYDPEQTAMALKSQYGKYVPKPEVGGIQGFANKIGPYAPFLAAAAAFAGPALAAELAAGELAAGASVPLAEITGSTFAGPAFTLPGAATAATVGAPILDPVLGITSIAPEAAAYPGMSAELAAELGLAGSSSGLSGAGASGDVLAGMGIPTAGGGMSVEQALMTKMLLDNAAGGGQGGQGGDSTTTTSTPFSTNQANPYTLQYNPNTGNQFTAAGMTNEGFYGYKPTTYGYDYGIKPLALRAPEIGLRSRGYAEGGIADLGGYAAGGKLLKGPGDGMSDSIVANIGGKQPARLADGEFVIPADVVSHLGNGSTDAGAKQLYKMMDRIRHARTGNKKQGKQINPTKFLPKG